MAEVDKPLEAVRDFLDEVQRRPDQFVDWSNPRAGERRPTGWVDGDLRPSDDQGRVSADHVGERRILVPRQVLEGMLRRFGHRTPRGILKAWKKNGWIDVDAPIDASTGKPTRGKRLVKRVRVPGNGGLVRMVVLNAAGVAAGLS